MFEIRGDWRADVQEPRTWSGIVRETTGKFMIDLKAWWRKQEERAAESRQRKRETEKANRDVIAPGVQ